MPTFTAETPTITRKFYDMTFTVPAPFTSGHQLTAPEATFLNSTLASVVGNAFSGDIRRALVALNEEGEKAFIAAGGKKKDYAPVGIEALRWDFPAKFAERYADYELGASNRGSGAGTASSDPLARMVNFIASEDLKAKLARKNLSVSRIYKAPATSDSGFKTKWAELLANNIEKNRETFTAQAQAQLDSITSDAEADDDLLEGVELPQEEVAAAAE